MEGHRMELRALQELLDAQSGVVARRQVLAAGGTDLDVRRWVRGRELARVHTGVYVNHTGPLTWSNRAWAAVHFHWPAALAHRSAVDRAGAPVHVAIDASRAATRLPGIRVHRLVGLDDRVLWNLGPPRVRTEDALLSVAASATTRADALAIVVDGCRRRLTTPARLATELARHPTLRHRRWLLQVLQEASDGVQSFLESTFRRRVERAHGLPRAERQVAERTVDGLVYRDVHYRRFGVVVELDGRVGHESGHDRWDDQDRDLLAATEELLTVRLGWRHAEVTPCRTGERLGRVLQLRGWRARPVACGSTCVIGSVA